MLPSGTRGRYNAVDLAAFLAAGRTVPHCCEQLKMYGDLVYATPGLRAQDVGRYFKDATFGVPPGEVERRYSPRPDVTIVRPLGPAPWKPTDVLATASLIGGIFGKSGGAELEFSEIRQALHDRFGARRGTRIFRDSRSAEDPRRR